MHCIAHFKDAFLFQVVTAEVLVVFLKPLCTMLSVTLDRISVHNLLLVVQCTGGA